MSTKVEHHLCKSVPHKHLKMKKMSTKLGSTKEGKNCIYLKLPAELVFDAASFAANRASLLRSVCTVSVASSRLPSKSVARGLVPVRPGSVIRSFFLCYSFFAKFALERIFADTGRSRLALKKK